MLTSRFVLVDPSPGSFLFTSATVPNHLFTLHYTTLHYTTLWCDTEPIRYATLHFRDLRRAASLRNRAEITVLICEQKLYPVEFSCRRKSHAVYCEHNLKLISPSSSITGRLKDNEYPSLTLQDHTH